MENIVTNKPRRIEGHMGHKNCSTNCIAFKKQSGYGTRNNYRMPVRAERSLNLEEEMETNMKVLKLVTDSKFTMTQINGQRRLGPPPDWDGPSPGTGCEVFVARIPKTLYEDDIYPLFRSVGEIFEIRLMMDFSGMNRGYCFVMYTKPEYAVRAVKELDQYEIRPGKKIGVVVSINNCRLYIGRVPPQFDSEFIIKRIYEMTDEVEKVAVYRFPHSRRSYALVSYKTHRGAAMARRRLVPETMTLLPGNEVTIDWAHPNMSPINVYEECGTCDKEGNFEIRRRFIGTADGGNKQSSNSKRKGRFLLSNLNKGGDGGGGGESLSPIRASIGRFEEEAGETRLSTNLKSRLMLKQRHSHDNVKLSANFPVKLSPYVLEGVAANSRIFHTNGLRTFAQLQRQHHSLDLISPNCKSDCGLSGVDHAETSLLRRGQQRVQWTNNELAVRRRASFEFDNRYLPKFYDFSLNKDHTMPLGNYARTSRRIQDENQNPLRSLYNDVDNSWNANQNDMLGQHGQHAQHFCSPLFRRQQDQSLYCTNSANCTRFTPGQTYNAPSRNSLEVIPKINCQAERTAPMLKPIHCVTPFNRTLLATANFSTGDFANMSNPQIPPGYCRPILCRYRDN